MVDRVARDAEDRASGEEVPVQGDAAWGNDAGEAEGAGGVDAEGLVDDVLDVFEVFDLIVVTGFLVPAGITASSSALELLYDTWSLEDPVEERAGGVGGCVAAGDELG